MAKADGLYIGVALHEAGQHGHGVGVVQEPGVGADSLHILGKIGQHGDGTQGAEDTADAQGIGDGLTQTVLLGDLKIGDGAGIVAAHLNGVDHKIGTAQSIAAVSNAQILADLGTTLVDVLIENGDHGVGLFQALLVNIVQSDLKVAQGRGEHRVTQNVFGKYCAAGTHKCDFSHFKNLRKYFLVFSRRTCYNVFVVISIVRKMYSVN